MVTLEPENPRGIVVFGAGAWGDPDRYRPFLEDLRSSGFIVLAPRSERFDHRTVTTEQLIARPASMLAALSARAPHDLPITAMGHSIGGWAALCLAGAVPYTRDGQPLPVPRERRVCRLVLFAPTVGWFQAPGALTQVSAPMKVFVGDSDTVTPPATAEVLQQAPVTVDVQLCRYAGHFDFMNTPPPGKPSDPKLDRTAFLRRLATETVAFASALQPHRRPADAPSPPGTGTA